MAISFLLIPSQKKKVIFKNTTAEVHTDSAASRGGQGKQLPTVSAWGRTIDLNDLFLIYTLLIGRSSPHESTQCQALAIHILMFIKMKML